jgi:hypothetical protein
MEHPARHMEHPVRFREHPENVGEHPETRPGPPGGAFDLISMPCDDRFRDRTTGTRPPFSDPDDEALRYKVNELILALRRT